ncbi:hypothetical protein [Streptomyces sp. NPDC004296]|uniref:hypothetical protein n=1 Tax=Streptomyces sp. NPDC004296 TaxID=3364697 RepID=UPI0036CC1206
MNSTASPISDLSGLRGRYEQPLLAYINERLSPVDWRRGPDIARMAWAESVGSLSLAPDVGMEDDLPAWLAAAARRAIRSYLSPTPQEDGIPKATSAVSAQDRQILHALTALSRTTPGRRRLVRDCAEQYLSQVDRQRLPVGYDQPISTDWANRADAHRMRHGDQFARMLGISCRPGDRHLPATARAVIAAVDAPVEQLVDIAQRTGDPAGVAVAHVVSRQPAA